MSHNNPSNHYNPSAPSNNKINPPTCYPPNIPAQSSHQINPNEQQVNISGNNSLPPINLNINIRKNNKKKRSTYQEPVENNYNTGNRHTNFINRVSSLRDLTIPLDVDTKFELFLPVERREIYNFGHSLGVDVLKYPFC